MLSFPFHTGQTCLGSLLLAFRDQRIPEPDNKTSANPLGHIFLG
jgi:hypothetical protein